MMRSLYSGVAGLRNHQTRMDVIGNNIANVNTVGFKASRVTFNDIFSETIRPGSATNAARGGQNPMQIGLGMAISSIDVRHGRSSAQNTGGTLDVSIGGDGFFTVSTSPDGSTPYYTRAGNFRFDAPTGNSNECNLLDANGNVVLGYPLAPDKVGLNPDVPKYKDTDPALGPLKINFDDFDDVSIDKNGAIVARVKPPPATGTNFGSSHANLVNQKVVLGWLCISTFSNPTGLQKEGNNLYSPSPASGEPMQHVAGSAATNAGPIIPGTLEMSNVDIAEQFTDMIVTQRGFQANSRIITVSDQMLEELVNIKR